jgi:histone-lysine N-methyltransferase SETDB1
VARKSTRGGSRETPFHNSAQIAALVNSQPISMNQSKIYCDDSKKGKQVFYTVKENKNSAPIEYTSHECGPQCLHKMKYNLKAYSPLAKPLICGFERQLCKIKSKKTEIMYRAPCGRRLRHMDEVHYYLRITQPSKLNISKGIELIDLFLSLNNSNIFFQIITQIR